MLFTSQLGTINFMKRTILLITVFLLSLASSAEWTTIIKSKNNSYHAVDTSTAKTNKNLIYYWALENSAKPDAFGALSKAWYIEADCNINRYKILSTALYKEKGAKKKFNTFNNSNASWDYPTPGSVASLEVSYMCKLLMAGENQ